LEIVRVDEEAYLNELVIYWLFWTLQVWPGY
jgi:hypothetical protein